MKTNLKKLLAGALAVSAVLSAQAFPANAATPGVSAVNMESVPMGHGNAYVAVLPAKSNPTNREKALIDAVKTAATYFNSLGFSYSNSINYYNSNNGITGTTTAKSVYVSLADFPGAGNAVSDRGVITLGPKADYMNELYSSGDAVAHEYAHLVTQQKLNWSYRSSTEFNAIVEAYSDILGELSETYPDWKMGSKLYRDKKHCLRDLSDPNSSITPTSSHNTYSKVKYYTKADEFRSDAAAGRLQTSNGNGGNIYDCYTGSTVLSHAAYLMHHYGISRDDLAKIWYQSLSYYDQTKETTFEDCRVAVTKAADSYLGKYDKATKLDKMRKISEAFDSAHIYTPVKLSSVTVAQNTLQQTVANNGTRMSDFMRSLSYKYPLGYYWTTDDVNTASRTRIGQSNGITIGPTFYRNFNTNFDYINEEPYYQCAGFARKLQQEYFETSTFLQLSEEGGFTYVPRMGDHLRVAPQGYSPYNFGHSIFISYVTKKSNTEYSFTYADCNANADDKIAYNKQGSVKKSNGNLIITLGNNTFQFRWVERPVMVGDVNGDSYVDSKDITLMQKLVNNSNYRESYSTDIKFRNEAADLNRNGKVDNSDLTALKNAVKSGVDFIGSYYYLK